MNLSTILKVLDGIVIIISAGKTIIGGFDKNSNDSKKDPPQY